MEQDIYTIQSNLEFILFYLKRIITITNDITKLRITKENVDDKMYDVITENIDKVVILYKQIDIEQLQDILD